jgi:hypothetical protein
LEPWQLEKKTHTHIHTIVSLSLSHGHTRARAQTHNTLREKKWENKHWNKLGLNPSCCWELTCRPFERGKKTWSSTAAAKHSEFQAPNSTALFSVTLFLLIFKLIIIN